MASSSDQIEIGFRTSREELEEELGVTFTDLQWSRIHKDAIHAYGGLCGNLHWWLMHHSRDEVLSEASDTIDNDKAKHQDKEDIPTVQPASSIIDNDNTKNQDKADIPNDEQPVRASAL